MKRGILYAILAGCITFSCTENEENVIANFDAQVTGESPDAQVEIINKSEGASTYSWTFGEGADVEESTEANPAINVDKAGEITITLVAMNGSVQNEVTKTVIVPGNSAITTYSDVEFALNEGDPDYGRFFSFDTEEMYLDDQIDENTGAQIDLAFTSLGNTMYYFESPASEEYNIPNARSTKVNNYESSPSMTANEFDAMTDDEILSGLNVQHSEESFGNSSTTDHIITFELSSGRKGAIKTKVINSNRLLTDIKIQKY